MLHGHPACLHLQGDKMPTVRRMRRIQVLLEARIHADEVGRRILQAELGMSSEEASKGDT